MDRIICGENGRLHVVEAGDTMYKLSKMYHVSLSDIMRMNPNVDVYNMQVADQICIPFMYDKSDRYDENVSMAKID